MKQSSSTLLAIAATACFTGSAYAAVFSTSFSDYNLGELNNQNGWTTSDPTATAGGVISITGGDWNGRAARLGFVAPIENNSVYLSHAVNTPLIGNVNASFSTLFQVQDSDAGYGAGAEVRDTFGFSLKTAGGANIFSFFLSPFDQDPAPQTDVAFHTYSWSTGTDAPTVILGQSSQENFAYTLGVDFYDAGGGVAGFNAHVNSFNFSGLLGAGSASATIGQLGATWKPLDQTGTIEPGSNFLIFDDVSLVPEPSSAMLGLLGVSLVFIRRRR